MELRHLQTLLAVDAQRSFTQAAKSLGITQAAVSQHVAALEEELGAALFERQGRRVEPTAAGRQVREAAARIFAIISQVQAELAGGDAVAGTLRIATSTVPSETILPELLAEFRRQHPHVREELSVSDSRAALQAVQRGAADVGFVGEKPESGKLGSHALAADELVLVVAARHELAGEGAISLKRLARLPLVIREPGSGSRACLEQALAQRKVALADLQVAMEANSNEAIRAAVLRGRDGAFLSAATVAEDAAAGRLAVLKVRGLRPRRQLFLIYRTPSPSTSPAKEFLAFLKSRPV
jgi:DNA-binding transcriptional LysR family regulator